MDTEERNTFTLYLLEEAATYNRWIFNKISPWLGKSILEVGCGIGNLTGLLLGHGKVIVADMNENYLQIVKNKFFSHPNLINAIFWNIQERFTGNPSPEIDTIVCSNVLEHVENDNSVLKNFYQLLPAGGRLIIFVPALKILYNQLDLALGHFRRYNKNELLQKLTLNGFKVQYLKFFNFFGILGWFVNGTILRRHFLSQKQVRIFDKMVPFFIWLEKVIPSFIGQSLIAIGERE